MCTLYLVLNLSYLLFRTNNCTFKKCVHFTQVVNQNYIIFIRFLIVTKNNGLPKISEIKYIFIYSLSYINAMKLDKIIEELRCRIRNTD